MYTGEIYDNHGIDEWWGIELLRVIFFYTLLKLLRSINQNQIIIN